MSNLPQNIPSKNPAISGNLGASVALVIRKALQETNGQLPCVVLSYNRRTNRARVQPQIAMLSTGGAKISRAPIASVPVLALGGGGFFINFPLVKGSRGWIEASDRDISLYLQAASEQLPNTARLHSFEDGRFIPDVFKDYIINDADANSMVISSTDGTVRVALSPDTVTITAPNIKLDTTTFNLNATGAAKITAASLEIDAPTNLTQQTTIEGREFLGHEHGGVASGGSNSGGVV